MCSMYVGMWASLESEQMDRFHLHWDLMSSSNLGQCPVNKNIWAPEREALEMGSKTQNGDLIQNVSNDSDSILMIYEIISPDKTT
jgi:hypothetical protein